MKILSFKNTPSGTKILVAIIDAKIDRLETRAVAIKHVTSLPEYADYLQLFKDDKALISRLQRQGQKIADSLERHKLLNRMASMKVDFEAKQRDHEADNTVYLTPANALLVDDETAKAVADMAEGENYIRLVTDEDGKYASCSVILNKHVGKRWRLPGSMDWQLVQYPDEVPPTDAVFTEPTDAERIKALDPEARKAEKAAMITNAENGFLAACQRADYLGGDQAERDKQTARTALEAAKKDIKARYQI